MAGRQGFEPRYRGPEGAKEAPLISVSVGFARESASQLRAVSGRDGTFAGESFKFLSSHVRLIHKRAANVGTNGDSAFTDVGVRPRESQDCNRCQKLFFLSSRPNGIQRCLNGVLRFVATDELLQEFRGTFRMKSAATFSLVYLVAVAAVCTAQGHEFKDIHRADAKNSAHRRRRRTHEIAWTRSDVSTRVL
jgi:hypothetical protein